MGAHIELHVDYDNNISLKSDLIEIIQGGLQTNDYEELINKPSIEGNVLIGDQSFADLGITPDGIGVSRITNSEIEELFKEI